jgi:hypothetical protein
MSGRLRAVKGNGAFAAVVGPVNAVHMAAGHSETPTSLVRRLSYRPGVVDYLRAVDFEVVLARFCSGSSTEGWVPLSLNPDDPVACRLGIIERPLGWLPLSVLVTYREPPPDDAQLMFFVPPVHDAPLKVDMNLMEVAPFSLSKTIRQGIIPTS